MKEALTAQEIIQWLFIQQKENPDALYDIDIHHKGRSLAANNYFHRLVRLIATGKGDPVYAVKNEMIMQYGNGKFERTPDGKLRYELLDDNDNYKRDPVMHYVPTVYTETYKNRKLRAFAILKGTHTYNSTEMAALIDGTRNECIGCDIPMSLIETFEEKRLMEGLRKRNEVNHPDSE